MAATVHMPQWGMAMTEGTLVRWLKKEGDRIEKGEPLFEAETEKIVNEAEARDSGILFQIVVQEGEVVPVGTVLALIAEEGETPERIEPGQAAGADEAAVAPQPAGASNPVDASPEAAPAKGAVRGTPSARKLARELGVDLALVSGSGASGRVTRSDVEKYHEEASKGPAADRPAAPAAFPTEAPGDVTVVPYAGTRKKIGDNMMMSLQKSAQLTCFAEVDITEMVKFRDAVRTAYAEDESVRISFNDIILLAVSRALKEHPVMNSTHVGNEILLHGSANIGMAVALPNGLMVPVLKNVDRKGLLEIAKEARELAARTRDGSLSLDDLSGGTFTVTNTSMIEVDGFTAILRPPETGILAVGRAKRKPAEHRGEIALRWMMWLGLTYNHCAVDGAPAHAFLATVGKYLETPLLIMI